MSSISYADRVLCMSVVFRFTIAGPCSPESRRSGQTEGHFFILFMGVQTLHGGGGGRLFSGVRLFEIHKNDDPDMTGNKWFTVFVSRCQIKTVRHAVNEIFDFQCRHLNTSKYVLDFSTIKAPWTKAGYPLLKIRQCKVSYNSCLWESVSIIAFL